MLRQLGMVDTVDGLRFMRHVPRAYLRYRGKIARYCDFPRKAHGSVRASDTGHRDLSADDGRYLMVSGLKSCMYDKIILLFQAAHARE